ncbi:hypothetical protein [Candidatus Methylomirabilis sp.]|uniref:hypothetical protein n=1 Tax=Candidatus Methylomirabilis sp. TaxID=2032687 RepID=UPI003C76FFFB
MAMKPVNLVVVLALAVVLITCTAISYHPALFLGPSPVKIPAKIQVETFVDRSPSEDKTKCIRGDIGHRVRFPGRRSFDRGHQRRHR